MKVGQWYKNGDTYECVFITPSGNIVLRNTRVGTEFVESKDNAIFYKLIPPPPKVFTGYALVYPFGWNSAKFAVGNLYGSLEEMDSHHKENDINLGLSLIHI